MEVEAGGATGRFAPARPLSAGSGQPAAGSMFVARPQGEAHHAYALLPVTKPTAGCRRPAAGVCPPLSKIRGRGSVPAVPVLDRSIRRLQEPEKAAGRAVPQGMAARFHLVARLDVLARHADSLKPLATGGFEGPDLRLALAVRHLQIDPG